MDSLLPSHFALPELSWKTGLAIAITPLALRTLHRALAKPDDRAIQNIDGPPPVSRIAGNMPVLFNNDSWEYTRNIAIKYGRVCRLRGVLGENILYTYDPKAMHEILVKGQGTLYDEAAIFTSNNYILFGPGLLGTIGEQHRRQRKLLNPVFSTAHLRHSTATFFEITDQLRETLRKKTADGRADIEMMTWLTRTALEIVGQSGLGTSFNPVDEEHGEHPFIAAVKGLGPLMTELLLPRVLFAPLAYKLHDYTAWLQRLIVRLTPWPAVQKARDIVDTIHATSVEIFEDKRKAIENGSGVGDDKDIITILMKENMKASAEDKLTDAEVIGQMSTLMFAAMDTTSSALSRILHTLSLHQSVQDKLRAELRQARENYGDHPTHDQLVALPYLDAVCRETLRLYSPIGSTFRETRTDVLLPLSKPIKGLNGKLIHEIFLPKNSKILISLEASNCDPELWGSDAEEWRPERWLSPPSQALVDARIPGVYSHLMTFIGGPRACIGFKFSQLEMKVILFTLLNNFKFELPTQEIFWQKTVIVTPTTDPKRSKPIPDMPLKVTLLTN